MQEKKHVVSSISEYTALSDLSMCQEIIVVAVDSYCVLSFPVFFFLTHCLGAVLSSLSDIVLTKLDLCSHNCFENI